MCGICGIIGIEDKQLIKAMAKTMSYRGPDAQGFFLDKNVSLGHKRLSIIDVVGGKQPMTNKEGNLCLVYNGEIYNFKELRKKLGKKYQFKTNSDTEVILHAYEEYGNKCVEKFNGAFAFAIWDSKKKSLFLARDRLGIKPLFYTLQKGKLAFASELKSLLCLPWIKKDVNHNAIEKYFAFNFIQGPETIFKEIFSLQPGHIAIYKNKKISITEYWDLSKSPPITDLSTVKKELYDLLNQSVKYRLMSDVPLGLFLSGGMDSNILLHLASQHSTQPVKTFTIDFEEAEFSESALAKQSAEYFGADSEELIIKSESFKLLPKLVWGCDQPFADPSILPTFFVSELASKKVKVVLSGDGGDELFAGYQKYFPSKYEKIVKIMQMFPHPLRKAIYRSATVVKHPKIQKAIPDLQQLEKMNLFERYMFKVEKCSHKERGLMLKKSSSHPVQERKKFFDRHHFQSFWEKVMYMDLKTSLPDDLLLKVDRMTMMNSIEGRVPLLDHKVVEYAARIPLSMKRQGTGKLILKQIFAKKLPKAILNKPKSGFGIPINKWLNHHLKDIVHPILFDGTLKKRNILNIDYVKKLFEQHRRGQRNNGKRLLALINFELWNRLYRDNIPFSKIKL